MTIKMSKEYLLDQYKNALLDLKTATSSEKKNKALDDLNRLETLSVQMYGFELVDNQFKELKKKYGFNAK